MTERYILTRALTGEILTSDLPFNRDKLTQRLSGAGTLTGDVPSNIGSITALDGQPLLQEWGTLIYVEMDDEIRWGGIVVRSEYSDDTWSVEATGFISYPHGIPYSGEYSQIQVDPADVVRHIWAHIQAQTDGNLNVTVTGSTPKRIGTEAEDVNFTTSSGSSVSFKAGPYTLNWAKNTDCGKEIDDLAQENSFDFVERHSWVGDTDEISHTIEIGYPRLGRKRDDLIFSDAQNIIDCVVETLDGDEYANNIVGIGSGEGTLAVRSSAGVRDGRLRRVSIYSDKSVDSQSRMQELVNAELAIKKNILDVASITIIQHPNAEFGSWNLGDDLLIQLERPNIGEIAMWSRVTSWTLNQDDTVTLTLIRSDAFTGGS